MEAPQPNVLTPSLRAEGEAIQCPTAGVPQSHKRGRVSVIGPEFGTVSRPDLVTAAREAGEAGFDLLIACAFPKPTTGRIAVKVINHLGDEVMKVFKVG